ncbi:MAG: N-formylglutamate amidohydrolase [Paracoccaceae bacterium]
MSSNVVIQKSSALAPVHILNSSGASQVVLVCEHASNVIPKMYDNLGLSREARNSHVVWDPGALGVAQYLSEQLDAVLVAGGVSRLVYDCNRPPDAPDAMPARSELFDIPGNLGLGAAEITKRVSRYYQPFCDAVSAVIVKTPVPGVLVTVHSFTPVFMGQNRSVEIGILHDSDSRLADEMMRVASKFTKLNVQRNQPYGVEDGVTHTLKIHGIKNNMLNVMLEIRNDLISTVEQQEKIATQIAGMLSAALAKLDQPNQGNAT